MNFTENLQFKIKNFAGRVAPIKSRELNNKRIHEGIKCDHCKKVDFEGDRFCCTVCDKYNLCSECFCSSCVNKNHDYNHPCLLITYPIDQSSAKAAQTAKIEELVKLHPEKNFGVDCSICTRKIKGVYLKCNKCYSKHFCYNCWKNERHDKDHTLILFTSYKIDCFDKNELKMIKPIGNGNFGFVYQALLKPYNCNCACKLINKNINLRLHLKKDANDEYDRFMSIDKELEAYVEIVSPFICKLLGYGGKKPSKMFLVMEYMENGSLEDLILNEKTSPVSLYDKFRIIYHISYGLTDMHEKNFIHADLKPKNILLSSELTAKICDLGSAKNMNKKVVANKQIGGLYYLPYEFYAGRYDEKIDIYSFGLVTYHLFCGHRHSYNTSGMLMLDHINLIPNNFVKAMTWKATQFKPIRRGMIHYYRDIFRVYVEELRRSFELNKFDEFYEILNCQQRDMMMMYVSDALVEFVEKKLNIKLAYDSLRFDLEQAGIHEEIRVKLEKMVEDIRADARNITSKVNIVELTNEEDNTHVED